MTTLKKGERARWNAEPVIIEGEPQMMVQVSMAGGTTHVPVDQLKPAVDWATSISRDLRALEYERRGQPKMAERCRNGQYDEDAAPITLTNYIRANHLTVDRLRDAVLEIAPVYVGDGFIARLYTALTGEKA